MTVDIIIPAYNPGTFILEAIQSCLGQSYRDIKITVVDDCSTQDLTYLKNRFPKVNFLRTLKNGGPAAARNYGIQNTNGELVSFLDADDVMLRDKIFYSVEEFQKDPYVGMTCGNYQILVNNRLRQPFYPKSTNLQIGWKELMKQNYVASGSTTVRRSVLESVGGFDERFWIGEDADLWLRISEQHGIKYIPKVLYIYRIVPGGLSLTQRSDIQKEHLNNLELMRKASKERVKNQERSNQDLPS